MKKFLYFSAAALTALVASSCSSDDIDPIGDDGMTTFTVQLPDDLTRAFGDAPTNQQLNVAIYEAGKTDKVLFESINGTEGTNGMIVTQFAANGGLAAKIEVSLVKGKAYDLVLWSQDATNHPYTYKPETQTLTVTYGAAENPTIDNYADNRDAFFVCKTITSGDPANSDPIELKRMFAQVNVGTADLDKYTLAGGTDSFGIKLSGLATELNLKTGIVTNPTGEAVIATTTEAASSTTEFPAVKNYTGEPLKYLGMAYVLVGNGTLPNKSTIDVTLNANGNPTFATYPSVPVQMNYRTNIYGDLLTNPEVFNVEIDPIFGTPDILYGIWDGKTVSDPVIDNTAKTVTVSSPDQFAGLAALVKGGNKFEGYTVHIQNSMDFNGFDFPVLFSDALRASSVATGGFRGTIDGHGNTFKNVKIGNALGADNASAVFGAISGAGNGLKNLNFVNFTINNTTGEQSGVVGMLTEGATVSNVNIYSGNISGTEGVGSIVGRILKDGTVENCTNNANVTGTSTNVGGIVGAAYYTEIGKEMHITGCVNTGSVKAGGRCTGGIVGLSAAFIEGCTNEGTVESGGYYAGGIAGDQTCAGGIKDCHNKANVTNKQGTVGGIAGMVQYLDPGSYPNMNLITIELCSNSGNIKSDGSFVGGIVGLWNKSGYVKNCTNTATSLQGARFIAGLVGLQGLSEMRPDDVDFDTLFVQNNTTTTTLDQMTGSDKVLLINHNGYSDVSISGNTPENNN